MQYFVALFLVFRLAIASDLVQRASYAGIQTLERKTLSVLSEFESTLLRRTPTKNYRTRIPNSLQYTRTSNDNNHREFSTSLPAEKQRTSIKLDNENLPSSLGSTSKSSTNGYDSEASVSQAKQTPSRLRPMQAQEVKGAQKSQRSKELQKKRTANPTPRIRPRVPLTREQKDRRNALDRQRRKDVRLAKYKKTGIVRPYTRVIAAVEKGNEHQRTQGHVLTAEEAKRERYNANKRRRYRDNKIKNKQMAEQQALNMSSVDARKHRLNTRRAKRNNENKAKHLQRAQANDVIETSSTDHAPLSLNPERYDLRRQERPTKRERSSDSVSISSVSKDLRAHERLTGSEGEIPRGNLGTTRPAWFAADGLVQSHGWVSPSPLDNMSPIRQSGILSPSHLGGLSLLPSELTTPVGSPIRAPSENTIQQIYRQMHDDEFYP